MDDASWHDVLDCVQCGYPLTAPGAILITPPKRDGSIKKLHYCKDCFLHHLFTGDPDVIEALENLMEYYDDPDQVTSKQHAENMIDLATAVVEEIKRATKEKA